jgi:hypothetical protein
MVGLSRAPGVYSAATAKCASGDEWTKGDAMASDGASSELPGTNAVEVHYHAASAFWVAGGISALALIVLTLGKWTLLGFIHLLVWNLSALVLIPYFLWRGLDRRPILVLDEEGLRDRRLGSVLLPWSQLKRASEYCPWTGGLLNTEAGVVLHFDRVITVFPWGAGQALTSIVIRVAALEISPHILLDLIRRFAPHAQIDGKRDGTAPGDAGTGASARAS